MIEIIAAHVIPAAYQVLPPAMNSPQATALLLAIGLQESKFTARRQTEGPARSWWMFEASGVRGVLTHERSAGPIRTALLRLGYREPYESAPLQLALEHNDILAACFARCLLWTSEKPLPEPTDHYAGWSIYLALWRPGRPQPSTWTANYSGGWGRVMDTWEGRDA